MEKSEHIENLYRKYIEGTCSLQELDELLDAFGSGADEEVLRGIIVSHFEYEPTEQDEQNTQHELNEFGSLDDHALAIADRVEARLFPLIRGEETTVAEPRTQRLWPRIAAAAAILIVVGAGLVLYVNKAKLDVNVRAAYANDIAPGKIGATLTLANGKKIRLADAANGEIAKEAGVAVTKTKDGQIIYEPAKQASNDLSLRGTKNTLSTAKGETYILTLPDKSKVWLNAASSLTYSASLNERGLRRVRLEGEGYFEIAKDKAHPFIVESNGQQVEVLGTHFNVSAYGDDSDVKTTLLEGSVKVNGNTVLKPGQQAVLYDNKVRVLQVNADDAIAWKDGLFIFEDEPLQSIMRKIERWYNVEVSYATDVDQHKLYWGSVSRYDNVSRILKRLELTKNIHFKIEGRRITVMR